MGSSGRQGAVEPLSTLRPHHVCVCVVLLCGILFLKKFKLAFQLRVRPPRGPPRASSPVHPALFKTDTVD